MGLRIIDRAPPKKPTLDLTDAERKRGLTEEARHWLMARGTHDQQGEDAYVAKLSAIRARQLDPSEIASMAEAIRGQIRAMNAGETPPHQMIGLARLLDLL